MFSQINCGKIDLIQGRMSYLSILFLAGLIKIDNLFFHLFETIIFRDHFGKYKQYLVEEVLRKKN